MPEPAPAGEGLSSDAARAELATTRGNPDHDCYHPDRPGYRAAADRLNALTDRLRGGAPASNSPPGVNIALSSKPSESASTASPSSSVSPVASPSDEDIAAKLAAVGDPHSLEAAAKSAFPDFTAPAGQTLDVDAVVALRGMELSHDVPVAELTALTTEYRQAWARRGDASEARLDQRDAALLEAWGDDYELELTRATEMAQRIPKRVLAHALQAGLHYDPVLWLKLSELWKKQHAR